MTGWLLTLLWSLLLPVLGLVAVIVAFWLGGASAAALVVMVGAVYVGLGYVPRFVDMTGKAKDTARLVFLNARIHKTDLQTQAKALMALQPDVIALVEVRPEWNAVLAGEVLGDYPHRVIHWFGWREGKLAYDDHALIASRWPLARVGGDSGEPDGEGFALYRVEAPKPFHVLVVHPMAPLFIEAHVLRNRFLARLAEFTLPADTLVVGDFNTVPWDPAMAGLWRRNDMRLHATWLPTYHSLLLGIPIDHVMSGEALDVAKIRRWSDGQSDHFGLVVDFSVRCPR